MKQPYDNFPLWMKQTTTLSDNSIYKYTRAIKSISKDMISIGIISKSLTEMNRAELDLAIPIILNNSEFIAKNSRGNKMYSNALKQFRSYHSMIADDVSDYKSIVDSIESDENITVTEKESLIKSRIGQGKFRKLIVEKYNGSCIITGINIQTLLVASHIKPWAASNNIERLSSENGLLLSATYDRLFDSGLISFENSGEILVSRYVNDFNRSKLGLQNRNIIDYTFSYEMKCNLEYHRDIIFLK
ncbi:MAG: HNH endonuclease [Clostridia bacterium]|nr:HNH endonuclease [Clostridia bacterium]